MKVTIDAAGRKVEVECGDANTSTREVLGEALAAWKQTDGATEPSQGPAFGLAAAAQVGRQQSPMNMGGGYGRGYVGDPKAEA